MASSIAAITTGIGGVVTTADNSGDLNLQSGTTTIVSITSAGAAVTGTLSSTSGTTIQGLTVGKGGGAVATNTAVGYQAINATATGTNNTAVGYQALLVNTTGINNTAIGYRALASNTTGSENTAFGLEALTANTTANENTAIGRAAMDSNTTGSANTALGFTAGQKNTTGSYNVSLGHGALRYNTTASYNTAIGYQAGFTNITGEAVTYIGQNAGKFTTGGYNSFFGQSAGSDVTSGTKNTIVGRYNGNQGGTDIRTASNWIVVSDGDGNPNIISTVNNGGSASIGNGAGSCSALASLTVTGYGGSGQVVGSRNSLYLRHGSTTGNRSNFIILGSAGTGSCFIGNDLPADGSQVNTLVVQAGGSGGVQLTSGATSWSAYSDARLKNVTGTYTNALADIAQLQPVKFTWKSDEDNNPQVGVIAQSVENVVPEAVTKGRISAEDETEYLSVKYTELIPLLIASIQELKAEIDLLKGVK